MKTDILTKDIINSFKKDGNTAVAISDTRNNVLTIGFNGKLLLKIASEGGRIRSIGYIKDDCLFVNRKDIHIFRNTNSFGFHFNLLKYTDLFTWVSINYHKKYYRVPKNIIIERGKIMGFANSSDGNSFELQIFLPIDIIMEYETKLQN